MNREWHDTQCFSVGAVMAQNNEKNRAYLKSNVQVRPIIVDFKSWNAGSEPVASGKWF